MQTAEAAEVAVTVNFSDGHPPAVFTLSPSGQLCPSNADGVATDALHWHVAATLLSRLGLRPPDEHTAARGPHGTCWPWADTNCP